MLMKVNPFSRNSPTRAVPKRKRPRMTLFLRACSIRLLGGGVEFRRGVHVRELVFVVEAHRHAEIVLAEEEDVNAGNGGDLGDVLDAGSGLNLQARQCRSLFAVAGVAEQPAFIHAALGEVDRARAHCRILRAAHGLRGLRRRY